MIKTEGSKVCLYSKDGKKRLGEFPFGEGEKYKDADSAKKAAEAREAEINKIKHAKENAEDEISEAEDTDSRLRRVRTAFRKEFRPEIGTEARGRIPYEDLPWARSIYDSEGYLIAAVGADKFRVNYIINNKGEVTFDARNAWRRVEMQPVLVENDEDSREKHSIVGEHWEFDIDFPDVTLEESMTEEELAEAMYADIALGEPGFGNKRDNHYYSRKFWKSNASKFEGAKMFTTDHVNGEHNERNRVATIVEAGKRFLPSGAPVARIAVHVKDFWDKLRTLREQNLLHTMHTSILATGAVKRGTVNGNPAKLVEDVKKVKAVDFVSKAGAGGRVLALAESMANAGDIDMLTFDMLVEHRPDLIEHIRQEEKSKVFGEKDEHKELKEQYQNLESEATQMTKTVEELQEALKEKEAELEALEAQIAEGEAQTQISTATDYLKEKYAESLPEALTARITAEIEERGFEEGADIQKVVDLLVEQEIEYAKSLAPGGKVVGMGESYQDDPADEGGEEGEVEEKSIEERNKDTDAVLARFGVLNEKKEGE